MMGRGPKKRPEGFIACKICAKPVYSYPCRPRHFCGHKCYNVAKLAKTHDTVNALKRCARCREWKPYDAFVRALNQSPIGLHSYCKVCSSTWFHEMRGTPEEKRKQYRPAYRLTDEEKRQNKREWNRRQHHARRAGGERPSQDALDSQLAAQHGRCAYCNVVLDAFHVDHKTPIARGGTNELSNLHFTCPRCNMRKGKMTHEEFLASKKRPVRQWTASIAA